jgi:hypothetical protein
MCRQACGNLFEFTFVYVMVITLKIFSVIISLNENTFFENREYDQSVSSPALLLPWRA